MGQNKKHMLNFVDFNLVVKHIDDKKIVLETDVSIICKCCNTTAKGTMLTISKIKKGGKEKLKDLLNSEKIQQKKDACLKYIIHNSTKYLLIDNKRDTTFEKIVRKINVNNDYKPLDIAKMLNIFEIGGCYSQNGICSIMLKQQKTIK